MENEHIRQILSDIENGKISAAEGYARLKLTPYEDLGFAKVDHHREVRQGVPEVIYGASKTKEQATRALWQACFCTAQKTS